MIIRSTTEKHPLASCTPHIGILVHAAFTGGRDELNCIVLNSLNPMPQRSNCDEFRIVRVVGYDISTNKSSTFGLLVRRHKGGENDETVIQHCLSPFFYRIFRPGGVFCQREIGQLVRPYVAKSLLSVAPYGVRSSGPAICNCAPIARDKDISGYKRRRIGASQLESVWQLQKRSAADS